MRRVDRLWIQAIDQGIDDKVVQLLAKLQVLKTNAWRSYMQESHTRLIEYRAEKARRKSNRSSPNSYHNHHQPPRSIKPTKQRRF